MKKVILTVAMLLVFSSVFAQNGTAIKITAGDAVIKGVLNNSAPSRDLIAKLPLEIHMMRWGDREYYGKTELSKEGIKQSGFKNGDITYWAPGGSFAIFYDEGKSQSISDLIHMGKITSDLSVFGTMPDSVVMIVEKDE